MHTATLLSFQSELEKISSHAAELAGLGILAAPSIGHLRGKDWSEKNKARAEVAGLGVLAAPSAYAVGKAGLSKLKGLASKMPKHAAPTMGAMMNMHRLADAAKAAKGAVKPMAQAAAKPLTNPNNMARASHLAGHMATGGHAWNPATAAKRAISL
jgi:hypothetical protein